MKKQLLLSVISAGLVSLGMASSACAALLSRDLDGDPTTIEAYYDNTSNLTWLSDANYAADSGYALANANTLFGTNAISSNGQMGWQAANDWASQLILGGVSGWRLPTTLQPDSSCGSQRDWGAGFPLQGISTGCTGSEMGNMFYNVLGGVANTRISTVHNSNYNLFSVPDAHYWSSTEFAPITGNAWSFSFVNGGQGYDSKFFSAPLSWAVHSGDVGVSVVPVPAAVWLFSSGMIGLIGLAKRNKT